MMEVNQSTDPLSLDSNSSLILNKVEHAEEINPLDFLEDDIDHGDNVNVALNTINVVQEKVNDDLMSKTSVNEDGSDMLDSLKEPSKEMVDSSLCVTKDEKLIENSNNNEEKDDVDVFSNESLNKIDGNGADNLHDDLMNEAEDNFLAEINEEKELLSHAIRKGAENQADQEKLHAKKVLVKTDGNIISDENNSEIIFSGFGSIVSDVENVNNGGNRFAAEQPNSCSSISGINDMPDNECNEGYDVSEKHMNICSQENSQSSLLKKVETAMIKDINTIKNKVDHAEHLTPNDQEVLEVQCKKLNDINNSEEDIRYLEEETDGNNKLDCKTGNIDGFKKHEFSPKKDHKVDLLELPDIDDIISIDQSTQGTSKNNVELIPEVNENLEIKGKFEADNKLPDINCDVISLDSPAVPDLDASKSGENILNDSLTADGEKTEKCDKHNEQTGQTSDKQIKIGIAILEEDDNDVVVLDEAEKHDEENVTEGIKSKNCVKICTILEEPKNQKLPENEAKLIDSYDYDVKLIDDLADTEKGDFKFKTAKDPVKFLETESQKPDLKIYNDDDVVLLDEDESNKENAEDSVKIVNAEETESSEKHIKLSATASKVDQRNEIPKEKKPIDSDDVVILKDGNTSDISDKIRKINSNFEIGYELDKKSLANLDLEEKKMMEQLVPDNSDNAQDKFTDDTPSSAVTTVEEENNLLKQTTTPENSLSHEGFNESQSKNKIIDSASILDDTDADNSTEPPQKKKKTNYDGGKVSNDDNKDAIDDDDVVLVDEKQDITSKSLKRSCSPDSVSQESKKAKVFIIGINDKLNNEDQDLKKIVFFDNLKPVSQPAKKNDLNLDFLKHFKKSISKMTKADLEEFVLQKIVEVIVHKSEFSEMRELFEKQEKIITTHRTKIAEISKQFRDLEMVHNRVLKDLEAKNQQFVMPVKITRAVGLQVLIPKKSDHLAPNKPNIDNRSLQPQIPATPSTPPNTDLIKKVRCTQKVTPMRPDTAQQPPMKCHPVQQQPLHILQQQQQCMQVQHKGIAQKSNDNGIQSMVNTNKVIYKQVARSPVPLQTSSILQHTTPQLIGTPNTHAHVQGSVLHHQNVQSVTQIASTSMQVLTVRKSTSPRQSVQKPPQNQPQFSLANDRQRIPPMILKKTGCNSRVAGLTGSSTSASLGQSAVVAQTQAATSKSFIDLTDEDDASTVKKQIITSNNLPALVAIPKQISSAPTSATRVTYVVNKPNSAPQRVTVTQHNTNSQRMPVSKIGAQYVAIAPKMSTAPTLAAISPSRLATNIRQRHPAPLPKAPTVMSNPGWKIIPPRPSIRINNIDSGIVISWTMDDMNEAHAEVVSYQIYAYQETSAPPQVEAWRHVGDVKAMLLPMAVTLTQFQEGQRYYFAVRAVDNHNRYGPFSMPKTWV